MLELQGLAKRFKETPVYSGVNLHVGRGEFVAILGESGVGKSTLLNLIAGLDTPSSGRVLFDGRDVGSLSDDESAGLRRREIGFVFQAFHVLAHLTVAQNIALPLLLNGIDAPERVSELLRAIGMPDAGARLPQTLSGGQLQRVALARALVHRPRLLLADEPTGNLDPDTARRVMALLTEQVRLHGTACLLVTHSEAAARCADRVLRLTPQGLEDAGLAVHP